LDDGVVDAGRPFLVMDLLVGASLSERQREARGNALPVEEVLFIGESILDVLAAAHERGIVHRDLKPDNVFLTVDGAVKVLDFGVARLKESTGGDLTTRTGVVVGTPAYMPPEQARGHAQRIDARSDLWAVGAILFTLLTGRRVNEGDTPNEVLLNAMSAHAPLLRSLLPDADEELAALVDRALAFEPDDRWSDARAMCQALRNVRARLGENSELQGRASSSSAQSKSGWLPNNVAILPRNVFGRLLLDGALMTVCLFVGATHVAPAKLQKIYRAAEAIAPELKEAATEAVGPRSESSASKATARAVPVPIDAGEASPPTHAAATDPGKAHAAGKSPSSPKSLARGKTAH
jgi:serine/threonine-protein kinase